MIKIDPVIKLLKKEKEMAFEDIFKAVKDKISHSYENEADLKADLYVSMIDTKLLIMIGENKWGMRDNYSTSEISNIERENLGQISLDTELEAGEETKEISGDKLKEVAAE